MEKARIFISYKRKNKKKVFSIVNKIESQLGVKCWIDLDGIESSAQFRNKICNAIDNSDIVLFMHSSVHLSIDFQKDWTIKELAYAEEKGKKVILIKLDDAPLDKDFLMEYGTKNNIDSRDETQFQKLLRDLKVLLDLPEQTQDNIKYNKNRRMETSSSLIKRIINRIKNWPKKAVANADNEDIASNKNRWQNTEQDNTRMSSSRINNIYTPNGELVYEGEMKNGERHGQGIEYNEDGEIVYEGQFKNDEYHGQGTYYYSDGRKYEGEFENDEYNGHGIEYDEDGEIVYEGQFKNGKFNGQGTYYYSNGGKYEGEFENNKFNGQGIVYDEDEEIVYEGEFKNDEYHGQGVKYDEDGKIVYEGQFKNGKFNGQGTLYLDDIIYEGEFENNEFNGHGALHFGKGNMYVGEFKNNKKHGNGTYYYADGIKENVTYNMGVEI